MERDTTATPRKPAKAKAARRTPANPARKRRALTPAEQLLRDNPHDHDTPEYRRYVVAALYSLMEADYREVPDYAAQVMQRYVDFELSMAEVVSRIEFGARNLC